MCDISATIIQYNFEFEWIGSKRQFKNKKNYFFT